MYRSTTFVYIGPHTQTECIIILESAGKSIFAPGALIHVRAQIGRDTPADVSDGYIIFYTTHTQITDMLAAVK